MIIVVSQAIIVNVCTFDCVVMVNINFVLLIQLCSSHFICAYR